MSKVIYKFSLLLSVATFIICMLGNISIMTSLFRSAIVFVMTLLVIVISINILRWNFGHQNMKTIHTNKRKVKDE